MVGNLYTSNFNMKTYFKYLLSVVLFAFISYYSLFFFAICYIRNTDLQAPAGVTTAVLGNSVGADSIDDSILVDFKNYCCSGLNFDIEEGFIKAVVDQNPQIKDIILCFDVVQYGGYLNSNLRHYKPSEYKYVGGYIAYDNKAINKYSWYELIKWTIGSNILIEPIGIFFGYDRLIRDKIYQEIEMRNRDFKGIIDIPYKEAKISRSYNHDALKRAIYYAQEKGLSVILLSTPMYQLDRWYGRTGYYDFLNTLDERVQIADYTDFPMPSDDYYGDVIHLNYKGAEYFSKHLKEHGLKAIPVKEYLRQRADDRKHIFSPPK